MALSSMTGFARSHGASGPYTFEWELKSVNAKGFDLRLRLPPGWDELEAFAKKRAGEVLSRGTVYANLNVKRANAVSTVRINEDVLASIVEKETGKADERSRVAAVFTNRLRQRIKLQSDPTIIYGLVGGKGTLGRPIKRSEITQPSPYNTYVIEGLPPGPIANPGRASLEAAANPARTRDLFFVADGTGGHAFTETYDAHQKNVAKLRALEKQIQNDTVEPSEDAPPPTAAGAPADNNPTATTRPTAPAKRPPARPAAPATAPARQGAAQQSTTTPPVVQR